jgi:hypothetical protein
LSVAVYDNGCLFDFRARAGLMKELVNEKEESRSSTGWF